MNKLVKIKRIFVPIFLLSSIMNAVLFVYIEDYELLNNICNYVSFISGIPALLCIGKEYLDYSNPFSRYCSRLSYAFYCTHYPIVVLCQYYISLTGMDSIYNFVLSLILSTVITCSACYIIGKSNVLGVLFGLKNQSVKEKRKLKIHKRSEEL